MADKGTTKVKHAARRIQKMGNEHIQQKTEGKKLGKKEYSTSRGQSIQRDEETKKKATSAGLEESTLPSYGEGGAGNNHNAKKWRLEEHK